MIPNIPVIKNIDRFTDFDLPKEKIEYAIKEAIKKIDFALPQFTDKFPEHSSVNNVYAQVDNDRGWNTGFWTGILWHAYELTGDEFFREVFESQLASYRRRVDEKIGMDDHDVGFVFLPSCVGAYKLTGNETAKEIALRAFDYYFPRSYSKEGKFIIRSYRGWEAGSGCRTMMDSLMNVPLFFWAALWPAV